MVSTGVAVDVVLVEGKQRGEKRDYDVHRALYGRDGGVTGRRLATGRGVRTVCCAHSAAAHVHHGRLAAPHSTGRPVQHPPL